MSKLKTLTTFIKISFKISKSYIFLVVLSSFFSSIIPFINIIFPKLIIDELLGERRIEYLIGLVITIIVINLILNFLNNTFKRIMDEKNLAIRHLFYQEMGKKILSLNYEMIEDPKILDLKERAVFACTNQGSFSLLINNLSTIIRSMFTLIGVIGILITFNIWILLFLIFIIILIILINSSYRKYQFKFFQSIIPVNRTYGHYLQRCIDLENGMNIRSYRLDKMFSKNIDDYANSFMKEFETYNFKDGLYTGLNYVLTTIQALVVYGYLALKAKVIGIGSFTMYLQASISFTKTTTDIFNAIGSIYQACDYLTPFMEFMNLKGEKEIKGKKILTDSIESIEFKNVSFKYPRSEKLILEDVSFKIESNDKISIVGLNGSGKTTLVKLLCRLYYPTSGEILVNNVNILEYDYTSYLSKLATVFQDYKIFAFSFKDNVILDNKYDENLFSDVINKISLSDTLNKLVNGSNTNLKKDFDQEGIELSGGQNQKVAIARALYKNSDLIILDEPTSALDPLAEYEIYNHFNNLVSNKMTIYISHRMSSSIFSDKILVIEDGKSVAFDTHQNLIKQKQNLYYKLYMAQAKNYKLDNI